MALRHWVLYVLFCILLRELKNDVQLSHSERSEESSWFLLVNLIHTDSIINNYSLVPSPQGEG